MDMTPERIYFGFNEETHLESYCLEKKLYCPNEYINAKKMEEWIRTAYGKVSMNPFDCSEAFEELLAHFRPKST